MTSPTANDGLAASGAPMPGGFSIAFLVALYRRHKLVLLVWIALGTALAGGLVFNLTPAYQATAELVLDSRVQRPDDYASVMSGPFTLADYSPIIRSETQVLQSPSLAARVIDHLNLANVKEFNPSNGVRNRVIAFLADMAVRYLRPSVIRVVFPDLKSKSDPQSKKSLLVEEYLRRLSVTNDGRSLTISVKFWTRDPELAAKIANYHVGLYIADQRALKELTAQHAADWIGQQIERLGSDLRKKEDLLRDFREKAGLVHAQGSTIVAQQAAQITDELSRARVDLAQREAMVAQLGQGGATAADVQSPVLNSLLIQHLRQQQSELTTALVKLESRYNSDSPTVAMARSQVDEVRAQIVQETNRIISSLRAEADVARARVESLSNRLVALQRQLVDQDRSGVNVTEMERDISAQSKVYQDLLSRQQQIAAQIGAEQADARIISVASVPRRPFYPSKALFMVLGFVLVSTSGFVFAYLLDRTRKGIDQLDEISGATGIMQFHALPLVPDSVLNGRGLPDHLVFRPMGEFADCVRSLRGDIMHSRHSPGPRVLALTSTVPGEGKTTVAASIGRSMASAGLHVLLIDCDLRRSGCAGILGATVGDKGLVSMLRGGTSLEDAVISDPRSSMKLLAPEQRPTSPQDLLDTPMLQKILDEAASQYDFIILDTPPIAAVADVWLVVPLADVVVMAVRWQSTSAEAVSESIRTFGKRRVPLAGLFLNGVNMSKSARIKGQADIYEAIRAYYPTS